MRPKRYHSSGGTAVITAFAHGRNGYPFAIAMSIFNECLPVKCRAHSQCIGPIIYKRSGKRSKRNFIVDVITLAGGGQSRLTA